MLTFFGVLEIMNKLKGVFYTDGGTRPSNGFGGYGVHGYTFKDEAAKKGTGLPDWAITPRGYMPLNNKKGLDNDVKVESFDIVSEELRGDPKTINISVEDYYDLYGALDLPTTNNQAELTAGIKLMELILELDLEFVTIYFDSKYVLEPLTTYLEKWRENGWNKSNNQPIANAELWKQMDKLYTEVKNKTHVDLRWIKGHSDHAGNDKADASATKGVFSSKILSEEFSNGIIERDKKLVRTANGYWKASSTVHPMVHCKNWYFNVSNTEPLMSPDGEYIYHFGNHGKEYTFIGKPLSDSCYSIAFLREPLPLLESVRERQCQLPNGGNNNMVCVHVDLLFNAYNTKLISEEGTLLYKDKLKNDLYNPMEVQLTKELQPPLTSINLVSAMDVLYGVITDFKAGKVNPSRMTEITEHFFDDKGKLLNDITQVTKKVDVEMRYDLGKNTGIKKVPITLGHDIPTRNYLAKLSKHNPKVFGITIRESARAFRFYTLIECDLGTAVYAGFYSNLLMV